MVCLPYNNLKQAMYYILSLSATYKHEKFMTLWRPNNKGYCYAKESAGVYPELSKGYENGNGLLLIPVDQAEKLFIPPDKDIKGIRHRPEGTLILNNLKNRKILGVHYKNKELEVLEPLTYAT